LGLILLLAVGLRFYNLGSKGLYGDEFNTLHATRYGRSSAPIYSPTHLLVRLVGVLDDNEWFLVLFGNPALPAGEIHRGEDVISPVGNDLMLRMPFAVVGVLSVLAVYQLGYVLSGPKEALIGALLLAFSPFHTEWSQMARYYALLVFLAILSVYFLFKALEDNRARDWIGFVLISVLSVYNVSAGFFPLASLLVFAGLVGVSRLVRILRQELERGELLSRCRTTGEKFRQVVSWAYQTRLLALLMSAVVIVSLCFPLVVQASSAVSIGSVTPSEQDEKGVVDTGDSFRGRLSMSYIANMLWHFGGRDGRPLYYSSFAFFLVGLGVCVYRRQWKQLGLILLWIGLPFVLLVSVFSFRSLNVGLPKHFIFILPAYLLMIAYGVVGFGDFISYAVRRFSGLMLSGKVVTLVLVMALAAMLTRAVWQSHLSQPWGQSIYDYPLMIHYYGIESASYLDENVAPGDVVVFVFDYRWNANDNIDYYTPPSLRAKATLIWMIPPLSPSVIEELLAVHSNLWIVGEYDLTTANAWITERIVDTQTIRRVPLYLLSNDVAFQRRIEVDRPITDEDRIAVQHFFLEDQTYILTAQTQSSCVSPIALDVELEGQLQGTLLLDGASGALNRDAWLELKSDQTGIQTLDLASVLVSGGQGAEVCSLDWMELQPAAVIQKDGTRVEAEHLSFPSGARIGVDQSGRGYVSRYWEGPLVDEEIWFEVPGDYVLDVMVRNEASVPIHLKASLDWKDLGTFDDRQTDDSWNRQYVSVRVSEPGGHRFILESVEPQWTDEDHYIYVDWFEFRFVERD
jgi:uncharacterized membrane protein